jgi:5-methylcytosine-specific restriction endonuclease McrA
VGEAAAALRLAGTGILDYGRAERIVPGKLRRALAHRDRGCIFPGCHRPPAHTEAHHVIHWIHGGETNLANCVLLCSRHHHFVHEGGWTITARPGTHWSQPGHWQFHRPVRR